MRFIHNRKKHYIVISTYLVLALGLIFFGSWQLGIDMTGGVQADLQVEKATPNPQQATDHVDQIRTPGSLSDVRAFFIEDATLLRIEVGTLDLSNPQASLAQKDLIESSLRSFAAEHDTTIE